MHEPRRRNPADETVHRYTCPLCECMCGARGPRRQRPAGHACIRGAKDDVWSQGLHLPEGLGARPPAPRPGPAPRADGPRRRPVARGVLGRGLRGAARSCCTRSSNETGHRRSPRSSATRRPQLLDPSLPEPDARPVAGSRTSTQRAPSTSGRRTSRSVLLYGNLWLIPIPDVTRTDYWLLMGGNPHASRRQPDGPARHARRDRDASASGAARSSSSIPGAPKTADTADEWIADPARHRRGLAAGDRQRAVRGGSDRRSGTSPTSSRTSTTVRDACAGLHSRVGRRA